MNTKIAYQNKDIVSKILAEHWAGKSLSTFGWNTDLKIEEMMPTNLPIVKANELRIDNLFRLSDGSIAILDYESAYKQSNMLKYAQYITQVMEKILRDEGKIPNIRMMVLYTADVEHVKSDIKTASLTVNIFPAYLLEVDSERWKSEINKAIAENDALAEEELTHMILLPLTYKGNEKKQEAIEWSIQQACKIEDVSNRNFALAGILTFTDKIISSKMRLNILEVIRMTQVGKMLIDEGRAEERAIADARMTSMIINLIKKNLLSNQDIADVTGVDLNRVESIKAEWEEKQQKQKKLENQSRLFDGVDAPVFDPNWEPKKGNNAASRNNRSHDAGQDLEP